MPGGNAFSFTGRRIDAEERLVVGSAIDITIRKRAGELLEYKA
jgi:hypothetical protein